MSDEKDPKENQYEHLNPGQADKAKKTVAKLSAIKAARELRNGDSPWTILQELVQEIQAGYIVQDPNNKVSSAVLQKDLTKEIANRYKDEEETCKILLEAVPHARSIRVWLKKETWEDAVWAKIRADKLFSSGKRTEVISALHKRAVEKSDVAAKIYLTLSGDYVEKAEINDKSVDAYREINKILHRKSED